MKVKVIGPVPACAIPFPKLMQSRDMVVLFQEPDKGTVIESATPGFACGKHDDTWIMSEFEDFQGSVTLSNT